VEVSTASSHCCHAGVALYPLYSSFMIHCAATTKITGGRRAPSRTFTTDAHLFFSTQFSYVLLLSWFGNLEMFGAGIATLVFVTTITRGRRAPSRMVTTDAHLFFQRNFLMYSSFLGLVIWRCLVLVLPH
jgi:hypothetical protein